MHDNYYRNKILLLPSSSILATFFLDFLFPISKEQQSFSALEEVLVTLLDALFLRRGEKNHFNLRVILIFTFSSLFASSFYDILNYFWPNTMPRSWKILFCHYFYQRFYSCSLGTVNPLFQHEITHSSETYFPLFFLQNCQFIYLFIYPSCIALAQMNSCRKIHGLLLEVQSSLALTSRKALSQKEKLSPQTLLSS